MKHQINTIRAELTALHGIVGDLSEALTALSELERLAGEPVATVTSESGNPDITMSWWHEPALPVGTKLYTTPPTQQPQYEAGDMASAHNDGFRAGVASVAQQPQAEVVIDKCSECGKTSTKDSMWALYCVECIETKIAPALAADQQPVATVQQRAEGGVEAHLHHYLPIGTKLYAAPQQTEVVRWCPDVCPITGKPFFMWIGHPKHGDVPTYGGPYDSYTIPVRHEDGSFCCERYDHDNGWWVTDEVHDVGVQIVSDQAYVSDEDPQQAEAVPVGAVLVNRESREGVMFYSPDMIPDPATLKDRFELVKVYAEPPAKQNEDVQWGVDWGTHGDRTCVSIIKKHPDGTVEVVATEYEPYRGAAPQQAEAVPSDGRTCTCHPDDNPPTPCAKKYALTKCNQAQAEAVPQLTNAFLADVMTAAGLVAHGKQCKALGERLGAEVAKLRPLIAAAPQQKGGGNETV